MAISWATFEAKFSGKCKHCGGAIKEGDIVRGTYDKAFAVKGKCYVVCTSCHDKGIEPKGVKAMMEELDPAIKGGAKDSSTWAAMPKPASDLEEYMEYIKESGAAIYDTAMFGKGDPSKPVDVSAYSPKPEPKPKKDAKWTKSWLKDNAAWGL